jgi:8-oxo-dGTP pyrophosphatase MutT (NUDIX family)
MPVPALPAAAVVLLRPPFELLLVQRNPELAFMGGFWVFPGGKVEDTDASSEAAARRELKEETEISLDPDQELVPFANWITPLVLPKRFDTWFFLTVAPAGATPKVDGSEIVAARWIRPADALAELPVAFPTTKQLEILNAHSDIPSLLASYRGTTIEAVQPEIVTSDGRPRAVIRPQSQS